MEPYSSDDIKRKKRKFGYILNRLLGAVPEIISAAIVSTEGFPIASTLPQGVDEARIAAMTAALLSLSERAIIEIEKGAFDQLYIKGSNGYLLAMRAGPNAILIVSTTKEVRLGLIPLDLRRIFDDDDDRYPYPYIYNPPESPRDLGVTPQLQVKKSMDKEPENEIYCQYCGRKLTKEERFSHNCRKKP